MPATMTAIEAIVRMSAMAIIAFHVTAVASWRRVRAVTRTSAAAAICSEDGAGLLRARLRGALVLRHDVLAHRHQRGRAKSGPRAAGQRCDPGQQRVGGLHEPALVLHAARAVAQVHVEAAGVALEQRAVEPVRDQALRALAPAAASERGDRLPELLAGRCEHRAELLLLDAEQLGHLGPRPVGERHQRQGSGLDRRQRGQHGDDLADSCRRVDGTGGSGGHWSQRRVLHQLGTIALDGDRASIR